MDKQIIATAKVTAFLKWQRDDLRAQGIDASKAALIDSIIARGDTLDTTWAELLEKTTAGRPRGTALERWQIVIDRLTDVALDYTPDKIKQSRDAVARVESLNAEIAEHAATLAKLLRTRDGLRAHGTISQAGDATLPELLQRAADLDEIANTGYLFRHHIAPQRHDSKYWPTMANLLDAFSEAQTVGGPVVDDQLTVAALASRQAGERDFLRAIDAALDELADELEGTRLDLSHNAFASLCNALRRFDELTPEAVKTYRAQQRKPQGNN